MQVDIVADADLRTDIEEDGDDTILKIAERPYTLCLFNGIRSC